MFLSSFAASQLAEILPATSLNTLSLMKLSICSPDAIVNTLSFSATGVELAMALVFARMLGLV